MIAPAVIENHIHHHFHSFVVCIADELGVLIVGTEPRVNLVVIGSGVTVVRSAFHIVFQHRIEPDSGDAQIRQIIQSVGNTFQVASVTGVGVVAVHLIRHPHGDMVVVGIAVGKPVGHNQVQHVRRIETFHLPSFGIAWFQFVVVRYFLLSVRKNNIKLLRSALRNI
ncbi:hypothetical protein SDC9_142893 [bioreactor metagenome]|uniref:Uncharacterized protein n=1 Tax=bioreactor metagenome TaxID=1076179 RepID=A0A645E2Y1_9ZZZZ